MSRPHEQRRRAAGFFPARSSPRRSALVLVAVAASAVAAAAFAGCTRGGPSGPAPREEAGLIIRRQLEAGGKTTTTGPGTTEKPTGYATLTGFFKIQGAPPANPALNVDKDLNVCRPGGQTVYAQELLVDPATQGIANVVLYIDKMPDEWLHESARPNNDEVVFDQKQCVFLTHVVAMQATQRLKVLNSDPVGHNAKIDPYGSARPFNETIGAGSFTYYEPGGEEREPFSVTCTIHSWMKAWLLTRKSGYFAVSGPDGTFEIPNLPAGVSLNFRAWQEKSKFLQEVTVNGQPARWSRGNLTLKLDPQDAAKNRLEVVIDAAQFR
jgi:hypothetical protein